jgi:hypothetical protein
MQGQATVHIRNFQGSEKNLIKLLNTIADKIELGLSMDEPNVLVDTYVFVNRKRKRNEQLAFDVPMLDDQPF